MVASGVRPINAERRRWFAVYLVVPAVLLAVFVYFRVTDRVLAFDAANLFAPYFTLLADFARDGRFLLWNPWSNCGSPDVAYVEMGSYSPITMALAWLTGGGDTGFLIYWLVIWGIGGTGMVALARHHEAPIWGALVVTIALMFSGIYLGHATHVSWLYTFSFLPWMVLFLDRSIIESRWRPSFLAGALYGLSALAGHPAIVIINGLYLATWAIGRAMTHDGSLSSDSPASNSPVIRVARSIGYLTCIVVIGSIVLAPTYGAFFFEGKGFSDRAGYLPREIAVDNQALPVSAMSTITSPYFPVLKFHNPKLWPEAWFGMVALYIGPLVPALAIMAIVYRAKDKWTWWLVGSGILFLALSLGSATPLRGWLYDLCPPTRYFRSTTIFRAYFLFSIASLAIIGSREFRTADKSAWKMLGCTSSLLSIAAFALYSQTLSQIANPGLEILTSHFHFFVVWIGLPIIAWTGWGAGRGATKELRSRVTIALILLAAIDGLLAFHQSMPLIGVTQSRVETQRGERIRTSEVGRVDWNRGRYPRGGFPHNDNLYSKTPMLENFNTLNSRYHTSAGLGNANWFDLGTSWCDEQLLSDASVGESRVWFTDQVAKVTPNNVNFFALVARSRAIQAMPVVVHEPKHFVASIGSRDEAITRRDETEKLQGLPTAQPLRIQLKRYSPNELSFEVDCPSDGWLLVTDRWARGWRCSIDGKPKQVWIGNYLFRAIEVQRGNHSVEFNYQPFGYPWLLILSWGTLSLTMAWSVLQKFAARPFQDPSRSGNDKDQQNNATNECHEDTDGQSDKGENQTDDP